MNCACGKPLHYSDPAIRAQVEALCEELGQNIHVTMCGRTFNVQRHYIALHGLHYFDLFVYNLFPEVTTTTKISIPEA